MRIEEVLSAEAIFTDLAASEKIPAIRELVDLLLQCYPELNRETIIRNILDREKLGSTGIENGVAVPHCKIDGLKRLRCCFARSSQGVEFQAIDGKPSHIFFLIVAPSQATTDHLKALATISKMCRHRSFRESVMQAESTEDIWNLMIQQNRKEEP